LLVVDGEEMRVVKGLMRVDKVDEG